MIELSLIFFFSLRILVTVRKRGDILHLIFMALIIHANSLLVLRLCSWAPFRLCTQNCWSSLMSGKWPTWCRTLWAACRPSCMWMIPCRQLSFNALAKPWRASSIPTQVQWRFSRVNVMSQKPFFHSLCPEVKEAVQNEKYFPKSLTIWMGNIFIHYI